MMNFERIEVFNFEGAFRGLRNPLNSWDKSDSIQKNSIYEIGPNDLKLAQRMIKGGNDESKFLRQIGVSLDIVAPQYFWAELDTYKVATVRNSCSIQHTLSKTPINVNMFSFDNPKIYSVLNGTSKELLEQYNEFKQSYTLMNPDNLNATNKLIENPNSGFTLDKNPNNTLFYNCLTIETLIGHLERLRLLYNIDKDYNIFRMLRQLMPMSFNYKSTWTANYAVLRNIYNSRRYHKLKEWRAFCEMLETLPYGIELICYS